MKECIKEKIKSVINVKDYSLIYDEFAGPYFASLRQRNFQRNVTDVTSRYQYCVQFEWIGI